jgi:hypothetical protein
MCLSAGTVGLADARRWLACGWSDGESGGKNVRVRVLVSSFAVLGRFQHQGGCVC